MTFSSLFLCTLLVAAPYAGAHTNVYTAKLMPFGDDSNVTGDVVVFTAHGGTIAFAGNAASFPYDNSTMCEVDNACGIHILNGTSCSTATLQGDNFYEETDVVLSDPWANERYDISVGVDESNYQGNFQSLIEIGTSDVEGRAVVVYGQDGSPMACGLLAKTTENVLSTETLSLENSNVTSGITTISSSDASLYAETDLCFFGKAYGLEPELVSTLAEAAGSDCTAVGACGARLLSGTGCTDSTTQGTSLFRSDMQADPWETVGYRTTDADGKATFFDCVNTGGVTFEGSPFVINADDGSRVSCGLLMAEEDEMAMSPTEAPTSSAGKLAPLASALTLLTTAVIAVTL